MYINKLINISNDNTLSESVKTFISNIINKNDIKTGRYEISDGIYANIERYNTKPIEQGKFESHDKYTDIQFLLNGKEKIYYTDRKSLTIMDAYNTEKDITFYKDPIASKYVLLDGTNYAVFPPDTAHAPQIATDITDEVLKVVVKLKSGEIN